MKSVTGPNLYHLWLIDPASTVPGSPYPLDVAKLSSGQRERLRTSNYLRWESNATEPLPWLYEPRGIELGVLLEEAIFLELRSVLKSSLTDLGKILVSTPNGTIENYRYVDVLVPRSQLIDLDLTRCIPPLPASAGLIDRLRIFQERRHAQQVTSIALPFHASSRALISAPPLPQRLVTEDIRDRWLATESSKRLRSTEGEFDILFIEFAAEPGPETDYLDYHWVTP